MTFTAGGLVTADDFAMFRDRVESAEYTYVPNLVNITDPASAEGRYLWVTETLVHVSVTVVWGPSTSVGGTIEIELPGDEPIQGLIRGVELINPDTALGDAIAQRPAGPSFARTAGRAYMSDHSFSRIVFDSTTQVGANATYPWTWDEGDKLSVGGTFRANRWIPPPPPLS